MYACKFGVLSIVVLLKKIKKRRVVGEEPGSNGISVLVSNGNDLAIQLHVEPTS